MGEGAARRLANVSFLDLGVGHLATELLEELGHEWSLKLKFVKLLTIKNDMIICKITIWGALLQ